MAVPQDGQSKAWVSTVGLTAALIGALLLIPKSIIPAHGGPKGPYAASTPYLRLRVNQTLD